MRAQPEPRGAAGTFLARRSRRAVCGPASRRARPPRRATPCDHARLAAASQARGGAGAACARSQSAEASRARLACARRDVSRRGFDAAWQHQRTRRVCSIRRCARARRTPSAPAPSSRMRAPPPAPRNARRAAVARGAAAAVRAALRAHRPLSRARRSVASMRSALNRELLCMHAPSIARCR